MTAPSSSCLHQSWRSGVTSTAFSARKQQALVLLLSQQLMNAQFRRADRADSERLWQEAAALELDVERLLHVLYSGVDSQDHASLRAEDDAWLAEHSRTSNRPRGWTLQGLTRRQARRPAPAALVSPA